MIRRGDKSNDSSGFILTPVSKRIRDQTKLISPDSEAIVGIMKSYIRIKRKQLCETLLARGRSPAAAGAQWGT